MESPQPVKDSLPTRPLADAAAFLGRLEAAGRKAGFRIEPYGRASGYALQALTRRTPGVLPRIYISSGIHGDEPAGPLALLEMIEAGVFDRRADWFLCPFLNPAGCSRGTRENPDAVDLNRDYRNPQSEEVRAHVAWLSSQPRFDVTLCVHEDWEAKGFYLYEQNPRGHPSLAAAILHAASGFCPIDPSPTIDGREATGGIIRPSGDPLEREKWPESVYLRVNHTHLTYTIEAPSALPLARRVAAHRAALEAAIRGML